MGLSPSMIVVKGGWACELGYLCFTKSPKSDVSAQDYRFSPARAIISDELRFTKRDI
ncbi:hypothetical protein QIS74_03133 [Colletotrichum tabaci]|uniref:Uncharacterized protein n=1 Tax=Colletotrichum tabaci TaxID=1209068 RepID=A0AAV9TMU4_9PEZI